MDLDTALSEAKLAINYFFNNKFEDARNLMKPWAHSSMYHSVGNCVFSFLEAILTFEQQHILEASEALKLCLNVCNRHRRKNTITETIGKTFKRVCQRLLLAFYTSFMKFYLAKLRAIYRGRSPCRTMFG